MNIWKAGEIEELSTFYNYILLIKWAKLNSQKQCWSFRDIIIYLVRSKTSVKVTCCLKKSALEALLAKISSPETKRSSRWIANMASSRKKPRFANSQGMENGETQYICYRLKKATEKISHCHLDISSIMAN